MAESLKVRPVPEQPRVAAMRNDMVDIRLAVDQDARTPSTERLFAEDSSA